MAEEKKKWVGRSMKRKEDLRLLTGRGNFIDDIKLPNMKVNTIGARGISNFLNR